MIIIEIQHSNDGTTAAICTTHTDRSETEQKYHQVLSAAAVSSIDVHSAVMLDDDGTQVKRESYYHGSLSE